MVNIQLTEFDRCPACKKKLINLQKERVGFLRASCGAIVCSKCGCHFFPKSMVEAALRQAKSPILAPTGQDMQLVKP